MLRLFIQHIFKQFKKRFSNQFLLVLIMIIAVFFCRLVVMKTQRLIGVFLI